jgi:SAM-dependent methyltransferase
MYPVEYQGEIVTKKTGGYDALLNKIKETGSYKTLLDYGCGNGRFIKEAIDEGYEITGAEYNPEIVTNLKKAYSSVQFFTVDHLLALNDKYDIIFLSNVIEHLTQPKQILNQLKDKLNENGIFVLEGPVENNFNIALIFRKLIFSIRKFIFNKKAQHIPLHLFYSNRKNQEQLFKDIGLTTIYFEINESSWPFPSNYNECDSLNKKITYFIASFSVFMSKITRGWGNNFIYIGKCIKPKTINN